MGPISLIHRSTWTVDGQETEREKDQSECIRTYISRIAYGIIIPNNGAARWKQPLQLKKCRLLKLVRRQSLGGKRNEDRYLKYPRQSRERSFLEQMSGSSNRCLFHAACWKRPQVSMGGPCSRGTGLSKISRKERLAYWVLITGQVLSKVLDLLILFNPFQP